MQEESPEFERFLDALPKAKSKSTPPDNCPHCGAEWNQLEKDLKECFTCGFPDPWDHSVDYGIEE